MLRALIWDVDGTLAETERDGHRVAFNRAFEAMGLPWRWDESRYGALLTVAGGRERLLADMATRADAPVSTMERERLAQALHARKNTLYAELVRAGGIRLRPGVAELLDSCLARGVALAIATTTSRVNVVALLGAHLGARWADHFAAVVCGEEVARKKPDPEVYRETLRRLNIRPLAAVAIEDSPGGAAAARAADVPVIVTPSVYFAQAAIEGAIAIGPGFDRREGWRPAPEPGAGGIGLADIEAWRASMALVSQLP